MNLSAAEKMHRVPTLTLAPSDLLAFMDGQRAYLDCRIASPDSREAVGSWFVYYDEDYHDNPAEPDEERGGWKAGVLKAMGGRYAETWHTTLREALEFVMQEVAEL